MIIAHGEWRNAMPPPRLKPSDPILDRRFLGAFKVYANAWCLDDSSSCRAKLDNGDYTPT